MDALLVKAFDRKKVFDELTKILFRQKLLTRESGPKNCLLFKLQDEKSKKKKERKRK